MPSKYPILKPKEIIRVLEKVNFVFVSQKGSHLKYTDGIHTIIIPNHSEVAKGTLKGILSQANMTIDKFLELLNK